MLNNNQFIATVTHTRCAKNAFPVTPSNTVDLVPFAYFGLIAAADGTITVDMVGAGTNVQLYIKAGILLPVQVRRVYATGTSATGIVALSKDS